MKNKIKSKMYVQKPIVVEAIQYDGALETARLLKQKYNIPCEINIIQGFLILKNQNYIKVAKNDYLIIDEHKQISVCDFQTFHSLYNEF